MHVYAQLNDYGMSLQVAFIADDRRRRVHIGPDGRLEIGDAIYDAATVVESSLRLDRETGQRLLDALIDAGMKPTTNPPTDQMLEAQSRHIIFAERVADELMQRTLPRPNTTEVTVVDRPGRRRE